MVLVLGCSAPRKARDRCRSVPLPDLAIVEPATEKLHDFAMQQFTDWLMCADVDISIESIMAVPSLLCALLVSFGHHLYNADKPLYVFLMVVTAFQRVKPDLKGHLRQAWALATNWRELEPTIHRTPVPLALFEALVALAILRGLHRLAACILIAFCGPTRITEVVTCLRKHLLLPCDTLSRDHDRAYIHFVSPKSRRRGGAKFQHACIRGVHIVEFLESVFKHVPLTDSLYVQSPSTFRVRWDALLNVIGVPRGLYTPACLRGGGAVAAYLSDTPIADIMWRMRIRNASTLEHYLQEVAATTSLANLPDIVKHRISKLSSLYQPALTINRGC